MLKNLSAVVLSGRPEHHLKTPTALLPFGEVTVLERTLAAYLEAGIGEVIVVTRSRLAEFQAATSALGSAVTVIQPVNAEAGVGEFLRRGAEQVSSHAHGFFVGLGDQPLLDKSVIEDLAARASSTKAKILVPVWQGILGQPIYFDASYLPYFKKLTPVKELWDLLKAHRADVIDYPLFQTSVVRHVEDMDDYHALLRLAGLPIPQVQQTPDLSIEPPASNANEPPESAGSRSEHEQASTESQPGQ